MTAPALSRTAWRNSSYSGNGGDCVEVADVGPAIAVHDSKNPVGPHLTFTPGEWRKFMTALKSGSFVLP
jgi:hypothetical protein